MSYMWNEFNIKTFPAETIVYRDGVYCADLSTLPDGPIDKRYKLPVHIIYIGEIAGKCRLDIDVVANGVTVFLSARVKNKKPAFLNISIKNAGKNSTVTGHTVLQNDSDLEFDISAHHLGRNTAILIKTKLIAGKNSNSDLTGAAIINKKCPDCTSDISFAAIAADSAKIKFTPGQFIYSTPKSAEHGAAIYRPTTAQIEYLRHAGITVADTTRILQDAFLQDFPDFPNIANTPGQI